MVLQLVSPQPVAPNECGHTGCLHTEYIMRTHRYFTTRAAPDIMRSWPATGSLMACWVPAVLATSCVLTPKEPQRKEPQTGVRKDILL